MNIIQSLKCGLTSKESLADFYARQNERYLEQRRNQLKHQYLIPGAVWFLSVMIFYFSAMEIELLALFAVSIVGVMISLYVDYKKRIKMIDQLLIDKRRENRKG